MKRAWIILIIALLIVFIVLPLSYLGYLTKWHRRITTCILGNFGLNTSSQAEQLIDKVKNYTNLFVIDPCTLDTLNETVNGTTLTDVCDYAVNNVLNIIVYFAYISHEVYPWQTQWFKKPQKDTATIDLKMLNIPAFTAFTSDYALYLV